MQDKLKKIVLKLTKENIYIHFNHVIAYNKFGYYAAFKNQELATLYHVHYFSKPVLQVNTLTQHFHQQLVFYQNLNSKIVTPVIEIIQKTDSIFVISKGHEKSLYDLIQEREGLSEFEIAYFLVDLIELMDYLRGRNCFIQKLQANDLFLNQHLKITINFNIFLNILDQNPIIKKLAFRHQFRNKNNCPDLFSKNKITLTDINQANSWNIGIILYHLLQNKKPFKVNSQKLILQARTGHSCVNNMESMNKKQYELQFMDEVKHKELTSLIRQLLTPFPSSRIQFNLIVIHPFLKLFPTPPHILPPTVFSCPPSQNFKEQYFKKFLKAEKAKNSEYQKSLRTHTIASNQHFTSTKHINMSEMNEKLGSQGQQQDNHQPKQFRTHKQLNSSELTLSQTISLIEEFADISDKFGFGYQMNSGLVCFVFNDETQYFLLMGNQKQYRTRQKNRKGTQIAYPHDKIPEQQDIRKKITILQAFYKSLKRTKNVNFQRQKMVTVTQYYRTQYASLFLLSNDTVQVFFNDKVGFLLSKNNILVQSKTSDKFQQYNFSKEERDKDSQSQMQMRRQYCLQISRKLFQWNNYPQLQKILDTDGLDIDFQT